MARITGGSLPQRHRYEPRPIEFPAGSDEAAHLGGRDIDDSATDDIAAHHPNHRTADDQAAARQTATERRG
jgi:hypothetical protein